jgi:DNA-binding transcriptional ArsR family regulator
MDDSIYEFQAEFCKAMGNAARLKILHTLHEHAKTVKEIVQETGYHQETVSRHLSELRNAGVVSSERRGTTISYSLSDPKVGEVCDLVRNVLVKHMQHQSQIFK